MNVQLSLEETYADIVPLRPAGANAAFLSIMRGCNNMCSFCVVPFTRGRERSRGMASILDEVYMLLGRKPARAGVDAHLPPVQQEVRLTDVRASIRRHLQGAYARHCDVRRILWTSNQVHCASCR